jgi:hypothetical protein
LEQEAPSSLHGCSHTESALEPEHTIVPQQSGVVGLFVHESPAFAMHAWHSLGPLSVSKKVAVL